MSIKFIRTTMLGCVTLSFLSAAGCSVEAGEEDHGDVASVQEALCSAQQMANCGIACSMASNSSCIEPCFRQCGGTGQRLYPWAVGCEASVGGGPLYLDRVIVMGPHQPGQPLMHPASTNMATSAAAPCDVRMRQIYRPQCGTLDRAATLYVNVGRSFVALDRPNHDYGFWSITQIATMPIAELCAGWTPPEPSCGRCCNL